ncbi:hypothetical protein CPB84DRAFT_1744880 [Gymnopilus junonius]|uniref:Uncharacterized protein n=1 Tax=Gymnopilus junonius TaxID=109634 RepID=A0A9P5NWA2_GYMJU|nr:hypothetical protein CPB84DRAFT_1744880 [Gymnopilus junonius]
MFFSTTGQRLSANGASGGSAHQNASNGIRRSRPLSLTSPTASPNGSVDIGSGGHRTGGSSSGSSTNRRHEEELINAYEAEEERIINVLSRKLEQLREDKIDLENALEAESENHVNRLSRELVALRQRNGELEEQLEKAKLNAAGQGHESQDGHGGPRSAGTNGQRSTHSVRAPSAPSLSTTMMGNDPGNPSALLMLDTLRRENEQLRGRLVDTEREFVRVRRLNEVYREELIDCRTRLGLPVDNLIGLTPSDRDPFSQPTHLRSRSNSSVSASFSPSASVSVSGMVAEPSTSRPSYYDYSVGHSNANSNASSPSTSVVQGGSGVLAMSYKPRFASSGSGSANSNVGSSRARAAISRHTNGVPIPRPSSQIRRPFKHATAHFTDTDTDVIDGDEEVEADVDVLPPQPSASSSTFQLVSPVGSTPSSVSAASSESPYAFSPVTSSSAGAEPASYVTDVTSPPSSGSFGMLAGIPLAGGNNGVGMGGMVMAGMGLSAYGVPQRGLTYPSVPPPSLSSSFGSPTVSFHGLPRADRDASSSPVEPLSRRGSITGSAIGSRRGSNTWEREREGSAGPSGNSGRRVVETGSLRQRRGSFDRAAGIPVGGRVAETGTLIGRSRAGSLGLNLNANFAQGHSSMPETVDEGDDTPNDAAGLELQLALQHVQLDAANTNANSEDHLTSRSDVFFSTYATRCHIKRVSGKR